MFVRRHVGVTTGDLAAYMSLDPGYQRTTIKTAGFPSQGLGAFNFATGCGTEHEPDLVTEICTQQIGWTGLMNSFRITFSSGYYITCWAGVCAANSQIGAPDFANVFMNTMFKAGYYDPYQTQAAWGGCIQIKAATSERVTAVRLGDYTNGQSEWTSNKGKLMIGSFI